MEPDGSGNAQAFDRNYHYRVTPRTYNDSGTTRTDLRSDETFATPDPNVVAYTYQISLFLCLFQMMDIDDDGFITDNDAEEWMENPVDVNQDASADMVDYALILDAANG